MKDTILGNLNKAQQKALIQTDGPMLILAGAGSGKTRVLTHKVAYLILEKEVDGSNILMVTFTNKAATEMKERINNLLLSNKDHVSANLPFAGTFHSLCAKILRKEGKAMGISENYIIYDSVDTTDTIKNVMKKLNISPKEFSPSAVASTISQIKNELISPLEYPQYARGFFQERVSEVYIEYQKLLKENNALDFDDLLFETVRLFEKNKDILGNYQNKFQYILVDEYQDTNQAQYTLTKLLSGRFRNIAVVGDASQSIYAWRGANFRNIINFKNDFPDAKVFNLEQNYRSTQKILNAAYSVISKNSSHPILKLWTENESGDDIIIHEAYDEQQEAKFIISEISALLRTARKLTYSSFVVLYRTNSQSRVLEEVFLHHGIPYILVGGLRFYERKEIKDVVSYLRLLVNPRDMVSYKRAEKLGKKRLQRFLEFAHDFSIDQFNSQDILDKVIGATDYLSIYDKEREEDRERLENIKELRSVAMEFTNIVQFLENISLVEQEYLPANRPEYNNKFSKHKKNAVTLMTLHAVKGLEFPVVFMVGMEEGLFPHARTLMEKEELEEERRLCYVGITRAMKKLYLLYAHHRLYFGQRNANVVSRFILDLPTDIVSAQGSLLTEHEFF